MKFIGFTQRKWMISLLSCLMVLSGRSAPVTLSGIQEMSLVQAIQEISKDYGVYFSFDRALVDDIIVNYDGARARTLEEAISSVLNGTGLEFKLFDERFVILYQKDKEGINSLRKMVGHMEKIIAEDSKFSLPPIPKLPLRNYYDNPYRQPNGLVLNIGGLVMNEAGDPLIGVNVQIKGTNKGTATDIDGRFTIDDVNENAVLVFSYIGFQTVEIPLDARQFIEVTLIADSELLEEVVVVGYGVQKKSDLTGAVSTIKSEDIMATPSSRIDDALRGKVAGVQITPTSSQPGAASSIRIRGTNSLNGNSDPLFVIDGLIGSGNSPDINIQDIESIEVLKDASATALYGSRGSAGVILITTKKGKAGQARLNYHAYYGLQSPTRLLDMLNAAEFGAWQNEVRGIDAFPNPESLGEGTNWQEEVYQNGAPMTSHTLSASGGSDKGTYFISGNYFDQEGIFRGGRLTRYQLRVNGNYNINRILKIGNALTFARTAIIPRQSNILNIAGFFPTLPVKDENGEYTIQTSSSEISAENPVGRAAKSINLDTRSSAFGTIYAVIEPVKNLRYKLNLGADLSLIRRQDYAPSTLFRQTNTQGTANIANSEYLSVLIEQTLNYTREFGDHSLDGLLGYTRQKINRSGSSVEAQGFTTDFFGYNNLNTASDRSGAGSNASQFGVESFLFRINYGFKDKYKLTVNGRIDGSSNFAAGNKWGTFPSVAVAWNIGRERFVQNLDLFDDLKIRASYGRLGNPASGGSSLARLGAGFTYLFGNSGEIFNGVGLNRLGNDELRFETTDQLDLGLEAYFFNSRLQVTIDYYNKVTNDLFVEKEILWLTGVPNATIPTNFGKVKNTGLELFITSVNVDNENFSWETSFNLSNNNNILLDIPNEEGELLINRFGGVINTPSALLREGEPIGVFYGYIRNGIWNTQAEIDEAGVTSGQGVFPGGKRYEDISGPNGQPDGVIDILDRTIIGSPHPDFFGGISNTFSFYGFDFNMYWSFVVGNEIFNETDSRINTAFDNNVRKKFVNRWTEDNTSTNVPSVRGVFRSEIISESGVVEDGTFLRLRNISLGYNIPLSGITWISKARIYANGTNLLLFDNYNGYDPEINRGNSNVRRGYDQSQNPALKSVTFGLNLTF